MPTRSSHATLAVVGCADTSAGRASWIRRAARMMAAWHERARQRQHLRTLDERMLKDLGLTRADVDAEAGKPFWLP